MKQIVVSQQIRKSDLAVAPSEMPKPANKVIITGDLTSKDDAVGEFTVTTHNIGYKKGQATPIDFVEDHPIVGKCDLEIGSKVTVKGKVLRIHRGESVIFRMVATDIKEAPGAAYDNRVMMVGRIMGRVNKADAKLNVDPMGWMFVDTSETDEPAGVRCVLFNQMLETWFAKSYPNRGVTLFGWLNNRPRWNSNTGDKEIVTEIRPDQTTSKMHGPDKAAPEAAFADDASFALPSMAFTEEAPAPATDSGKGKKKGGKTPF